MGKALGVVICKALGIVNGPIPWSIDGEPLLGFATEWQNVFVAAGFNAGTWMMHAHAHTRVHAKSKAHAHTRAGTCKRTLEYTHIRARNVAKLWLPLRY